MDEIIKSTPLVPVQNNQLVRLENTLSITNRLLFKGIVSIFNEAFYLVNSKDIEKGSENFCLLFELNDLYVNNEKFTFTASSVEDSTKAIELFTKAIELNPNFKFSHFGRGIAKYQIKDYKGAILDQTSAIKIDSSFIKAYINRGDSIYWDNFYRQNKSDFYKNVIDDYNKAIELSPLSVDFYIKRANAKWTINFQSAIDDCTNAIEIEPNNALLYEERASKKTRIDTKGAIEDMTKAIEIEPNNSSFYFRRGLLKRNIGDYEGAIKDLDRDIEINQENGQTTSLQTIFRARGDIKMKLNDFLGAIDGYTKAYEISSNGAYLISRGEVKYAIEDYLGAINDYTAAIDCYPYANAYKYRSLTKRKLGDIIGAEQDILKYDELIKIENASRSNI